MPTETVQLGDRRFPVVPQRHARLRNRLSAEDFERIMSKDYGTESYRVLCVLIPPLADMPLWEWEGYESQAAMNDGEYKEEQDKSPTTAQIVDAFEKALMVSGADRLGKILDLITSTGSLVNSMTPTPSSPPTPGNSGE